MSELIVPIVVLEGGQVPQYATEGAAGFDLHAVVETAVVLEPGKRALIPTNLIVALPYGYEMQIRPRSGLAFKHGVTVLNSPGTIDADYRGPVGVLLINHGDVPFTIETGERVAQGVVAKVETATFNETDILPLTKRGAGGWGSTGK
jgi:dUTP pyrophosphatase